MKVLVVTGGLYGEREVSLLSAKNVEEALINRGHDAQLFDFKGDYDALPPILKEFDVVFPVIHGKEGEDGDLQEFLEKQVVKFVGSTSAGCKRGWNKVRFKKFCDSESILTAPWVEIRGREIDFPFPYIIKPADIGSSIDVYIVRKKDDLRKISISSLLSNYEGVLAEEFIDGIEVTVGVLENAALPVLEIIPPEGKFFDYDSKYDGRTQEIPNAPSVPQHMQEKVKSIALQIHNGLGLRHYSRSDFIVRDGDIYALEVNTIPGLTKESLLPKAAKAAGMSFDDFIEKLINLALASN